MSSGSSNCLSKIRELDEDPGMNTTEGFEGSPTALVQSFVPSSDVTNLLDPMLKTNSVAGTGDGKSEGLRHRGGGLYNVSGAARIVRGVNTEQTEKNVGFSVCVMSVTSRDSECKADEPQFSLDCPPSAHAEPRSALSCHHPSRPFTA